MINNTDIWGILCETKNIRYSPEGKSSATGNFRDTLTELKWLINSWTTLLSEIRIQGSGTVKHISHYRNLLT